MGVAFVRPVNEKVVRFPARNLRKRKTLKNAFFSGGMAKPYAAHVFGLGHEWKVGEIGFEAVFW